MFSPTTLLRRAAVVGGATVGLGLLAASPALATGQHPGPAARGDHASPSSVAVTCDDGTRIRTSAPSGTVKGLCYHTHSVTAWCYTDIGGGTYWINLTDNTTHVSGWSAASLLYVAGSGTLPYC
jgi:hypothetical protein